MSFPTVCCRGHQHDGWESVFRCDHDTVSERTPDGRLIESSAPADDEPQQAALKLDSPQ